MKTHLEKTLIDKIGDLSKVQDLVNAWKINGSKVVFTNGVFDLLHLGHITYLAKSADLGDRLVIGLNADCSVRRLKGENRPVNDESSRAALLAALFFVDAVVIFNEDTPIKLISTLLPDILVKGADYSVDNIVGGQEVISNGGSVLTVNFVNGYSSTSIIERIANLIS